MIHEVLIWQKTKLTGHFTILQHVKITEKDVEEMALTNFKEQTQTNEDAYEYSATLDKTTI